MVQITTLSIALLVVEHQQIGLIQGTSLPGGNLLKYRVGDG
jgi:hypothetical protein